MSYILNLDVYRVVFIATVLWSAVMAFKLGKYAVIFICLYLLIDAVSSCIIWIDDISQFSTCFSSPLGFGYQSIGPAFFWGATVGGILGMMCRRFVSRNKGGESGLSS